MSFQKEKIKSIALLESEVLKASRNYLEREGFVEIVVPRIVRASGSCENVNTLFEVSVDNDLGWFFGKRAYLTQTGQLYLEALVPIFNKVYCAGDSFRAEPKVDNRHLAEFYMIEIEFAGNFDQLLFQIEGFIKAIVKDLIKKEFAQFGLSEERKKELMKIPEVFPKVTYDQAIELLKKMGEKIEWGDDITAIEEKMLVEYFDNQPLFITHYPDPIWDHGKEIEVEKFFNMSPDPENPGRVLSADLILPYGGEAVGAAQRVHEVDILKYRLKNSRMFKMLQRKGGSIDDFSWYIKNLEENGSVPHAGCGFGISRILKWIRASDDIRQCVAFPVNRQTLI
ncbi:MAG: amino acid--tRNA ligase-related protein [Patescibacteria group bacterium]